MHTYSLAAAYVRVNISWFGTADDHTHVRCKSIGPINGFSLNIWGIQSYCKAYKARLYGALQYH